MSAYFPQPSGGLVTRGSHVGGARQTPAGVPGSQYPSESASFLSGGDVGRKLYPFTGVHVIGKPLFARTGDNLSYTPPP